jgi:DNA-directed RNA polymerase subunit N (RpoN/RPB10)
METPNKNAAGGNRTAFISTQVQYNPGKLSKQAQSLDRSNLPNPTWVLDKLGIRYIRRPTWLQVYCPFHGNGQERNPSMGMHATDGHYRCHACGAKGGDVIAFYRAVTGKGFAESLKDLGVRHG